MIVVDSNVLAYFLIPGVHTLAAEAVFNKDNKWFAPQLWRSELLNILTTYGRAGLMTVDAAVQVMEKAIKIFPAAPYGSPPRTVLELSVASRCSGYDCEYVALAQGWKVPLVTADQQVLKAFPGTAVSMADFVK